MNKKPTLAIIGRPNVGKSALFNRIAGKRLAIVDDTPGITRDRQVVDLEGFRLIDTGGIDPHSEDRFGKEIRRQAELGMEEADSLILVVDATCGPTALDKELATSLLKLEKPLVLAVNKIDDDHRDYLLHDFYSLGISNMVAISAAHGRNIDTLLEEALRGFSMRKRAAAPPATKIAIVGKPNVGKSTLVNTLLGLERVMVSEIAGTTRDAIDIPFTFEEKDYVLIDTAGLKRKKAELSVVEKFATLRTKAAIERADVVLLVLDAPDGLTEQEKRIACEIEEAGKGCIILFNPAHKPIPCERAYPLYLGQKRP
jgi:GTP-binding protein